jgi:hypothetical protein
MPSVTVHLRLAERVLEHWGDHPADAPFDPEDAGAVNAFRQGAFGPDLGFVPGGYRPLSDLAHAYRSGDLTRALIRSAETPLQRAFAWGWVTHVLADTMIHPLVGCAVGELRYGSPAHFIDGDQDQVTHVRVEAGLDALYAERHPEIRRIRLEQVFDARSIRFLVEAYESTYGAAPAAERFLASHRVSARRIMQGVGLAAVAAFTMPNRPARDHDEPGPIRAFRSMVGRRNVGLAYILPAPPALWFINAVRDVEETFVDLFVDEYALRGEGLANVNLETGRPDLGETHYGGLRRSLAFLDELGALPDPLATGAA